MKKTKLLKSIYLNFLLLISCFANAQIAIHPYSADLGYLEDVIYKKVNEVRINNGVKPLVKASHLKRAAKTQAKYCAEKNKLTHDNLNAKYKTVEKRISSTGIKPSQFSENLSQNSLGVVYEFTADSIVNGWVNSPGHFSNMTQPDFQWSGISTVLGDEGKIYTAQVFSGENAQLKEDTIQNRNHFQEKLPFRLKSYEPDYATQIEIEKAYFLSSGHKLKALNAPSLKHIFKGPYDGIVFELVLGSQISCNSNVYFNSYNRRNQNSSVNGRLYFPHYTKELMQKSNFRVTEREFKLEKSRRLKKVQVQISKTTRELSKEKNKATRLKVKKDSLAIFNLELANILIEELKRQEAFLKNKQAKIQSEKWNPTLWEFDFSDDIIHTSEAIAEVNILFIKNNTLIRPMHYHRINYSGNYEDSLEIKQIEWTFEKPTIEVYNILETRKLKLNYDQAEHTFTKTQTDYVDKKLSNFIINAVDIKILASVEGTREINEALFKKRIKTLDKLLKPYLPKGVEPSYTTKENWALFYKQIEADTNFSHLKKIPKDSLRTLLSEYSLNKPWIDYLKQERMALFKVYGERIVTDTLSYLYDRFKPKDNWTLKRIQNYVIAKILDGTMSPSYIDRIVPIKDQPAMSQLILDKNMLKYTLSLKEEEFNYTSFLKSFRNEIIPKLASDTLLLTYFNLFTMHQPMNEVVISENLPILIQLYSRGYNSKSMAIFSLNAMPFFQKYVMGNVKTFSKQYSNYNAYCKELPFSIYRYYSTDSTFMSDRKNWENLILFFCEHLQYSIASSLISQYINLYGYDADFRFIQTVIQYVHPQIDSGVFAEEFLAEFEKMGKERWCDYFYGEHSPSFQILDYEKIWNKYCEECIGIKH